MIWPFLLILLVLFTAASAFVSMSQIALFSLSSSELKLYKNDPNPRRRLIALLLSRPRELLVTLMMCDIGANILVQNTASSFFGENSGWLLQVGVPLILTLFLGEIVPKTIALPNNTAISYKVAPTINILQKLLTPIRVFTTKITAHLSSIFFFFLRREEEISKEELHHVLKTSKHQGILTADEEKLVDGYLSLTDYTVKERMHPRHEVLYYNVGEPLSRLIYLFADQQCARVPICLGDLQNLQGILSAQDFLLRRDEIKESKDLLPYLRKPLFVPETILARTLLRQFLHSEEKMGIVVDEYGSITGLVTQEDLFEVVIGEIVDSRDEKTRYTVTGHDVIITSGKFELAEFEELFGVSLPTENNMVTIGGWLTEQLGDIPKSGTQYIWENFLFQVLASEPTRVRRLYIRRLPGKPHGK